jgi:DNA-binding NarL/FixJ family response regulator
MEPSLNSTFRDIAPPPALQGRSLDPEALRGRPLDPEALPLDNDEPAAADVRFDASLGGNRIVLIDRRALERECLARSLREHDPSLDIAAVGSIDEARLRTRGQARAAAILFILGSRRVTDQGVGHEISLLVGEHGAVPVIVVADNDEPAQILAALESGAQGYIPTTVGIGVAAEAIALARAGGIFVPANAVLALREAIHAGNGGTRPLNSLFTAREADVVEALRRGKANKIIAYELNLCESTVKVHIRNIMKKLKATNRTEVAYKLRDLAA